MSKAEVIQALNQGKKIRGKTWSKSHYIYVNDKCLIVYENGNVIMEWGTEKAYDLMDRWMYSHEFEVVE